MGTWGIPLILSCVLAVGTGSIIVFDTYPRQVLEDLSRTMTMRCSLNDTALSFANGLVGRRDFTETANNIQHVTSLVIMRNSGEHVASVSQFVPAKALVDLSNLQVTGDVSGNGNNGERGYIELTWLHPSNAQSGEYTCEVNAINELNHNVIFSTSVEVALTPPQIEDLVKYVQDLEKENAVAKNKLSSLVNDTVTVNSLLDQCCKPKHTEMGTLGCDDSDSWTQTTGRWNPKYKLINHKFNTPYDKPPVVKLGVVSLDHHNGGNTRFDVSITKVDRNGFQIKCETWANSYIYGIDVSWISLSQKKSF